MKKDFSFYVMVKNFNTGEIENYDIIPTIYRFMYNDKGNFSTNFIVRDDNFNAIPIKTKDQLAEFVDNTLKYNFWAKCEWEFIVTDWPGREKVDDSRPIKVDVYDQVKPNINIIVDQLWNEIKDLL